MSVKRVARLRINWFMVGSIFGVGISFFMNFLITSVVVPEYNVVMGRHEPVQMAETKDGDRVSGLGYRAEDVKAQAQPALAETRNPKPETPSISYPRKLALKLIQGKSIADMLIANHVAESDAEAVMKTISTNVPADQLKPGQRISVTLARHESIGDAAAVKELAMRLPNLSTVELERLENGQFNVAATKAAMSATAFRGYGVVKTSLFQAGDDGRIPANIMHEIVKAFSYDVDFQRDIHPGDTIEVLISRKENKGAEPSFGALRYAALTLRGKKQEIFAYKDGSGQLAWFDARGNSIKKSLLRTPLEAAHITSGFGMRTHPILGYSKFHKGVDFGAASGTPVMAAGDAVVEERGWKNGYGNFLLLKHNGAYETAYGHLSKFANIKVGQRVKQGQVVAYVGMTGMATGPHLHYEVREKGDQVNPVSKQFNMASGLTGKSLAAFNASKAQIVRELADLGGAPVVASAAEKPAKPRKSAANGKSAKAQKFASR
ncbi:MAG: peptidoglycan DD-metalloendopeptidase family protein [Rickettsiales bacterium]